jgi:hypothetical protein
MFTESELDAHASVHDSLVNAWSAPDSLPDYDGNLNQTDYDPLIIFQTQLAEIGKNNSLKSIL